MVKQVILTGIRANNDLHIGNYFGAMLPTIDMAKKKADEFQINLFIPDLHSFTTPIDHNTLKEQIIQTARLFVAAGLPLDDDNIHIYRQSFVPAHSELAVILNSFTGFGEMSRMTQFKDKSKKLDNDRVSVGLFDYPVLMASDILLYDTSYVPVGDDQSQHLEFTRNIASRMNSQFGNLFTIPKAVKEQHSFFGKDQGLRIKDLANPSKKMSKSDDSAKGIIFLGDNPVTAAKKIMNATTDSLTRVSNDKINQPGISNLLEIHALLRGEPLDATVARFEGLDSYGDFKRAVAKQVEDFLDKFQTSLARVDDQQVISKLTSSEVSMNRIANNTLCRVQKAIGLR
ncbi:tryptophan--tRNA ligase [Candidatus Saccharibacteria bacterium]|nr:tryptophan--tRNA ligase [Candidatus Saccharibacteria bacterium]